MLADTQSGWLVVEEQAYLLERTRCRLLQLNERGGL